MRITKKMVEEFNQTLENLNCSFKLAFDDKMIGFGNPICQIVPSNNIFIESSTINVTKEFYKVLEGFFTKRGIELSYNNVGSIFWSKDGWKDAVENT